MSRYGGRAGDVCILDASGDRRCPMSFEIARICIGTYRELKSEAITTLTKIAFLGNPIANAEYMETMLHGRSYFIDISEGGG